MSVVMVRMVAMPAATYAPPQDVSTKGHIARAHPQPMRFVPQRILCRLRHSMSFVATREQPAGNRNLKKMSLGGDLETLISTSNLSCKVCALV